MKLKETSLEIFESKLKTVPKIEHIAYRFDEDQEALKLAFNLGYSKE